MRKLGPEVDPVTGLPLIEIPPAAGSTISERYDRIPMPPSASSQPKPEPIGAGLLSPQTQKSLAEGAINETLSGGHPMNLLDHVVFALTGTPDSMLDADKLKERSGRRAAAGDASARASQDPGEGYMGAPGTGGSGAGGLGDILKLVMKGASMFG